MSGYIEVDAFKREMYHEAFETDTEMQRWDGGCWIRYKLFEEILKKQPTADVRENVHGEWIYKNDNILMPTGYWECSVCKEGRLMYEENFCPKCGTDMRKG